MFLIAIQFNLFEVAVLLFGAVVLGFAVHFFIQSRRSLKATLQATGGNPLPRSVKTAQPAPQPKEAAGILAPLFSPRKKENPAEPLAPLHLARTRPGNREESVDNLKETILQQQKLLNGFLRQVEEIENEGKEELA